MLYNTAYVRMNMVLGIVCFLIGIVSASVICILGKNSALRKKSGRIIVGKKISCNELPGRPTRYIVKVEYEASNTTYNRKVITADKNIKKCADGEEIRLLYVDKINKVYWAEDKSYERIVLIVLLVFISADMFLLGFECLFP